MPRPHRHFWSITGKVLMALALLITLWFVGILLMIFWAFVTLAASLMDREYAPEVEFAAWGAVWGADVGDSADVTVRLRRQAAAGNQSRAARRG